MAAHEWFDRIMPGPLGAMIAPQNAHARDLADLMGYRPLRQMDHHGALVDLLIRKGP